MCGKTRKGKFTVKRKTMAKCFRAKIRTIKGQLRRRLHHPAPKVGAWLKKVVQGWFNYHAIPGNYKVLNNFRYQVLKLWRTSIGRRSQKAKLTWKKMDHLQAKYLPRPRITHPYPSERFARQHPR